MKSVNIRDKNYISYKGHIHDLAFDVMFYKVQGQTTHNIILGLNKRPHTLESLNFYAFYVGISRVKYCTRLKLDKFN